MYGYICLLPLISRKNQVLEHSPRIIFQSKKGRTNDFSSQSNHVKHYRITAALTHLSNKKVAREGLKLHTYTYA